MIPSYYNVEERALFIMLVVHAKQKDKIGDSYIFHPMRVAANFIGDEFIYHRVVALLHDVIEDSSMTLETDEIAEFPLVVRDALDAITHREGESHKAYIKRLAPNTIARMVKCLDLHDNMHPVRNASLPIKIAQDNAKKYTWALHYLMNWEDKEREKVFLDELIPIAEVDIDENASVGA